MSRAPDLTDFLNLILEKQIALGDHVTLDRVIEEMLVDAATGFKVLMRGEAGNTPEFWNSCDAVAGAAEWHMFGVINCGKGQPGQVMHVGHGAAPCRFRNIAVRPA